MHLHRLALIFQERANNDKHFWQYKWKEMNLYHIKAGYCLQSIESYWNINIIQTCVITQLTTVISASSIFKHIIQPTWSFCPMLSMHIFCVKWPVWPIFMSNHSCRDNHISKFLATNVFSRHSNQTERKIHVSHNNHHPTCALNYSNFRLIMLALVNNKPRFIIFFFII